MRYKKKAKKIKHISLKSLKKKAWKKLRDKTYYQLHKELYRIKHKDYYLKNKEKIKTNTRQWYAERKDNPDFKLLRHTQVRKSYLKHRNRKLKQSREYRENLRKELIIFLGGKCKRCGLGDWRVLQIDHVNGGGRKELQENYTKSPLSYKLHIAKNRKKYQLLCANCNWIKRYENKETSQLKEL